MRDGDPKLVLTLVLINVATNNKIPFIIKISLPLGYDRGTGMLSNVLYD